jgi:GNAT superfamily N-acetyltransferase
MEYRVVEENLRVAMRCYSRVNDRGEARDYPGISVAYCGMPCSIFNSALLNGPSNETELRKLLALASVHFKQRGVGWTLWLCEDLLSEARLRRNARTVVSECGLQVIAQPPGMFAPKLQPMRRPPAPLEFRAVADPTTRLDFAHLSSIIFSLPFQTAQAIYTAEDLWKPPMSGWVGYHEGRPVTLASVVVAAGAAGVYSVGTLSEFQRRGFAETIVRHALERSRGAVGSEVTILQSTSQGMKLYSQMGYKPVTRFGVYMYENWWRS